MNYLNKASEENNLKSLIYFYYLKTVFQFQIISRLFINLFTKTIVDIYMVNIITLLLYKKNKK